MVDPRRFDEEAWHEEMIVVPGVVQIRRVGAQCEISCCYGAFRIPIALEQFRYMRVAFGIHYRETGRAERRSLRFRWIRLCWLWRHDEGLVRLKRCIWPLLGIVTNEILMVVFLELSMAGLFGASLGVVITGSFLLVRSEWLERRRRIRMREEFNRLLRGHPIP